MAFQLLPATRWGRIRAGVVIAGSLALGIWLVGIPYYHFCRYRPVVGDVLFQSLPHAPLVDAIEGCSRSPFSHCGIVVERDGRWLVLEALGEVRETPLWYFTVRGRGGGFAAYRFTAPLQERIPAVIAAARTFLGRPYDYRYDLDDAAIYCSELVYKANLLARGDRMGVLRRLGDLDWQPYEATISEIEEGPPPLDRLMITPRDLALAPQLEAVYRSGIAP